MLSLWRWFGSDESESEYPYLQYSESQWLLLRIQDFSSLRIRIRVQKGSQNKADRDPYQQCCGSVTFWFGSGSANGSGCAARSCCYRH
jgi:hypothetical protein